MAELTPIMQKFILHWGEMGSSWGINRAVAQIYALLYLSEAPLTADDICQQLDLARSTVSTGLRELQSWGIVKVVHSLGDRRDHFEVISDVWEMFRKILEVRKQREFDPTLEMLQACVAELSDDPVASEPIIERLKEMLDLFDLMTTVYEQVDQLPTERLKKMAHLGNRFSGMLERITAE